MTLLGLHFPTARIAGMYLHAWSKAVNILEKLKCKRFVWGKEAFCFLVEWSVTEPSLSHRLPVSLPGSLTGAGAPNPPDESAKGRGCQGLGRVKPWTKSSPSLSPGTQAFLYGWWLPGVQPDSRQGCWGTGTQLGNSCVTRATAPHFFLVSVANDTYP